MNASDRNPSPPESPSGVEMRGERQASPPASHRWLQNRGMVLAMLFLVTGALGIPLLWINDQFSFVERVVWSIILVIYTTAILIIGAIVIVWIYRQTIGAV